MFDQTTASQTVIAEYGRLIEIIESSDEAQPVLDGWTMADLAAHCDTAMEQQAESFKRGAMGTLEQTSLELTSKDRVSRVHSLRSNAAVLADTIMSLSPEQIGGMTPLPFGVVPTMVALQIAGLEAGFHRYDAEVAFDPMAHLDAGVASTLLDMAPGLAPMLAAGTWGTADAPGAPMSYTLAGSTRSIQLTFTGTEWVPVPPASGETISISGDDEAIALFFMGRRMIDHPSLGVDGDRTTAARFKQHFPGP